MIKKLYTKLMPNYLNRLPPEVKHEMLIYGFLAVVIAVFVLLIEWSRF